MTVALALPGISRERHVFERNLITRGDHHSGLAAVGWYKLARNAAPHDPAPAIKLAAALWGQGSREEAVQVLTRYKAPEALVLRGQYLVQLERYDEAETALKAAGGQRDAGYWLGVALAEQGRVDEAINVLQPPGSIMDDFGGGPLSALEDELVLGHVSHRPVSAEQVAIRYAKLGMIRSAQRVLADNHVSSASSWLLRVQLDQARLKPNQQEIELDYEQALAADPSNSDVASKLWAIATQNKDTAELQKLDQLKELLPSR